MGVRAFDNRLKILAVLILSVPMGVISVGIRSAQAQIREGKGKGKQKQAAFPYGRYKEVLTKYVDEKGMVDYRALKANREALDRFVRSLGELEKGTYRTWEKEAKIAFLINAYNAITLRIIVEHYPIKSGFFGSLKWPDNSIRQIDGAFDGIEHRVMGRKMTLDEIEHETLRKDFNEPRIHLALVCAAMSCPRLRREPYVALRLDEQFAEQARHFVRQPDNFRIDRRKNRVYLSEIFKWFGEDFIQTHGTEAKFGGIPPKKRAVLNYLSRHVSKRDRTYLTAADYRVKYLDYDWTLNEQ